VLAHALLVVASYVAAFLLRFDSLLDNVQLVTLLRTLPVLLAFRLLAFWRYHLFEGLWRYEGVEDAVTILKAVTASSLGFVATVVIFFGHGFPRSVLVTGAAGSIGSELCRQIADMHPDMLVMLERAESNLYYLELELRQSFPQLPCVPVIGDVLDVELVESIMRQYSPRAVFHAAAYKHVPLMEAHPLAAVENNVFGTEVLARAAETHGVERFVLISTDKAVRPVSVMGMTKRVAEGVLAARPPGPTRFIAVRFGNVLGSEGSMLPLFKWQIAAGGPVTVTDSEASRYFMGADDDVPLINLSDGLPPLHYIA
jgi:FlaA1/EpsC-like NDP-sugar epimerase